MLVHTSFVAKRTPLAKYDSDMTTGRDYVLVTPAKDEETVISVTIESVISQTIRPAEWVIVSDGSSDRTNEIIMAASLEHPWIRLLALPPRVERDFAAVVRATEAGVRFLSTTEFEYIGLTDADVRFDRDYFEKVIDRFESLPRLGVTGGMIVDPGISKNRLPRNIEDVMGGSQVFRRTCYEALGELVAIPEGGWDALTCARARMLGYETRLLTDLVVDHLKPRSIAQGGWLRRHWQLGTRDYAVGYHPLYELVKCISRSPSSLFVGSFAWWTGYCYAAIRRRERIVPKDLLAFVRADQMRKLKDGFPFLRLRRATPRTDAVEPPRRGT